MKLPLSPAQRLCLYNITYDVGQRYKGQEARRFRRFCRHFGIDAIAAIGRRDGQVSQRLVKDEGSRLFEVDAEDILRIVRIDDEIERTAMQEMLLGPLFDLALELKAERSVELPDVPDYDPTAEDWRVPEQPHSPRKLEAV